MTLAGALFAGVALAGAAPVPPLPAACEPTLLFPIEKAQLKIMDVARQLLGGPSRFVAVAPDGSRIGLAVVDIEDDNFVSTLREYTRSDGRWTPRQLQKDRGAMIGGLRRRPDGAYSYGRVAPDMARKTLVRGLYLLTPDGGEPTKLLDFERLVDCVWIDARRMHLFCERGKRERFVMFYGADVGAQMMKHRWRSEIRADRPVDAAMAAVRHGAYASANGTVMRLPDPDGKPEPVLVSDFAVAAATPSGGCLATWYRAPGGDRVLCLVDPVANTHTYVPTVRLAADRGTVCLNALFLGDGDTLALLLAAPDPLRTFWDSTLVLVSGGGDRALTLPLARPCLGLHPLGDDRAALLCYNGLWSANAAGLMKALAGAPVLKRPADAFPARIGDTPGLATPVAAWKSYVLARRAGNLKAYLACVTGRLHETASAFTAGGPVAGLVLLQSARQVAYVGDEKAFAGLKPTVTPDGRAALAVNAVARPSGAAVERVFTFERVGSEWKVSGVRSRRRPPEERSR